MSSKNKGKGAYDKLREMAARNARGAALGLSDTGVAGDAFRNAAARLGFGTPSLPEATEYVLERWTNDYWLMITLYRNHWIARRGIDGPAHDMTKAWAKLDCQVSPEDIAKFDRTISRTQTPARVRKAIKWARLFGGAGALMVIDGHEDRLDEPLDLDDVMPRSYKGLIVFDRWSGITPGLDVCTDINRPLDYGLPEFYDVRPSGAEGESFQVHCSRILRFTGPDVPSPEFEAQQRWGISVLEIAFDELKKRDNASWTILNLMFRAQILTQVNPELASIVSGAAAGGKAVVQLAQVMEMQNQLMSNQSTLILPKDGKLEAHQYSFAGLGDIYAQFQMDIAGAFRSTVTRMFGRTITGLGQTNDADEQQYQDTITEYQTDEVKPQLEKLYPVVAMSEWGEVPDDLDMTFPSIRSMTEKEKAELAKDATEAIMAPFNAGIRGYGSKTVLKEVRKLSERTGIGATISDEMIDAAPDDDAMAGEGNGPELPEIEQGPGNSGKQEQEAGEGGGKGAKGKGDDSEPSPTLLARAMDLLARIAR